MFRLLERKNQYENRLIKSPRCQNKNSIVSMCIMGVGDCAFSVVLVREVWFNTTESSLNLVIHRDWSQKDVTPVTSS